MVPTSLRGANFCLLILLVIDRGPNGIILAQFGGAKPELIANPDTTQIPVWGFQEEGYATTASFQKYVGTIQQPLASFTFCFRIQIGYERPRMYIFTYASSDQSTDELYAEYHLGRRAFRACKKGTKFCGWDRHMPAFHHWQHLCLLYNAMQNQYKVISDGEKVDSGSWSDNPYLVDPGGLLILGQDQDVMGGGFDRRQSFSGFITQFNLWDFDLEEYQIKNMATCRSDNYGNILQSKPENFESSHEQTHLEYMNLYKLCESSEHEENKYFLFNDPWSFEWYESWCVNMGGGLAIAENGEHYHAQMDYAEQKIEPLHEACVHSSGSLIIWLGLTDKYEEGVWMNPYTKEPMNYDGNWEHGKTDGGTHENCAKSYIDRKWADVDCHQKNCALCHFPDGMNLTIRGLCMTETTLMEGFFDTNYFIYGFHHGKPQWRGMGKSHVFFIPETSEWKLESFYDKKKYAKFTADISHSETFYPTGRHTWKVNSGICRLSEGEKHKLSLTNCILEDGQTDFTCADGTCIPIHQLCDLSDDCKDHTDEKGCDILVLPDDYRGENFPINHDHSPIGLHVNVSILAFLDIDTLKSSYLMDFVLSMKWSDPRLEYKNLKDVFFLNRVNYDTMMHMWTPKMSMPNALQAEGTQVDHDSSLFIIKYGQRALDNLEHAKEANVYKGKENPLVMKKEYFITFSCDFDLAMYPFDSNVCSLDMEVSGISKEYLGLLIDNGYGGTGTAYLGDKDLLEYVVGEVTMENYSGKNSSHFGLVKARIVFQRKWIYHLITIFLQSVLLLAVAYLTFYFRINNFQDRIMISITCMLIISTIQSSIDKMVPKTSYFKMVDLFLIYSFNIVIVIMGIHTYMDTQINRDAVTGMIVDRASSASSLTRVRPITDESEQSSVVSSARSRVGSMFGGSEDMDVDEDIDAFARARKINNIGKVGLIAFFFIFMTIFWAVALTHYFDEIKFGHNGELAAGGHGESDGHGGGHREGHGAPAADGHGALAAGGHGAPAAEGHGAPPASSHVAPAAGGHGAPSAGGHGAPAAGGHGAKAAGGHGASKGDGLGAPKGGGHGAPKGGGHGASKGGNHGVPKSGGHGAKKSGGHEASKSGGHGAPKQGGHGASKSGGHGGGHGAKAASSHGGGHAALQSAGGHGSPPPSSGHGSSKSGGHSVPKGVHGGGHGSPKSSEGHGSPPAAAGHGAPLPSSGHGSSKSVGHGASKSGGNGGEHGAPKSSGEHGSPPAAGDNGDGHGTPKSLKGHGGGHGAKKETEDHGSSPTSGDHISGHGASKSTAGHGSTPTSDGHGKGHLPPPPSGHGAYKASGGHDSHKPSGGHGSPPASGGYDSHKPAGVQGSPPASGGHDSHKPSGGHVSPPASSNHEAGHGTSKHSEEHESPDLISHGDDHDATESSENHGSPPASSSHEVSHGAPKHSGGHGSSAATSSDGGGHESSHSVAESANAFTSAYGAAAAPPTYTSAYGDDAAPAAYTSAYGAAAPPSYTSAYGAAAAPPAYTSAYDVAAPPPAPLAYNVAAAPPSYTSAYDVAAPRSAPLVYPNTYYGAAAPPSYTSAYGADVAGPPYYTSAYEEATPPQAKTSDRNQGSYYGAPAVFTSAYGTTAPPKNGGGGHGGGHH